MRKRVRKGEKKKFGEKLKPVDESVLFTVIANELDKLLPSCIVRFQLLLCESLLIGGKHASFVPARHWEVGFFFLLSFWSCLFAGVSIQLKRKKFKKEAREKKGRERGTRPTSKN
jgi:hypothetical protein